MTFADVLSALVELNGQPVQVAITRRISAHGPIAQLAGELHAQMDVAFERIEDDLLIFGVGDQGAFGLVRSEFESAHWTEDRGGLWIETDIATVFIARR